NKNQLLVLLDGEIDHHSSNQIRTEIDTAIYAHMPKTLVFDFQNVTFMDSSGIGLIMGRHKILRNLDSEIIIKQPSPQIARILRLSNMDRLAEIQINYPEEVIS
ncbi:MAG: anti-sigma factor antagonist, partial [Oscillospiraceae bacterium]|nr:anti-sigma factor antagonist [Oscillospiraceae bacterium]